MTVSIRVLEAWGGVGRHGKHDMLEKGGGKDNR